jgi:hypothetical protein
MPEAMQRDRVVITHMAVLVRQPRIRVKHAALGELDVRSTSGIPGGVRRAETREREVLGLRRLMPGMSGLVLLCRRAGPGRRQGVVMLRRTAPAARGGHDHDHNQSDDGAERLADIGASKTRTRRALWFWTMLREHLRSRDGTRDRWCHQAVPALLMTALLMCAITGGASAHTAPAAHNASSSGRQRCGRISVPARKAVAKVLVVHGPDDCSTATRLIKNAFTAEVTRHFDFRNPTFGIGWTIHGWRCTTGLADTQTFCKQGDHRIDGSLRTDDGWNF